MKTFTKNISGSFLILICLSAPFHLKAQMDNPLQYEANAWESKELIFLWAEHTSPGNPGYKQKIVGVDIEEYLLNEAESFETVIEAQSIFNDLSGSNLRPITVVSGDYNDDSFDEVVYAISEPNGIRISAPAMDYVMEINDGDTTWHVALDEPTTDIFFQTDVPFGGAGRGLPVLKKGQFDNEADDDFVIAARLLDGQVEIRILEVNGPDDISFGATVLSETTALDMDGKEVFDICTGDFNGDGLDEIALICLQENPDGPGMYSVFLRLFEVDGTNGALVEKGGFELDTESIVPDLDDDNNLAQVRLSTESIETESGEERLFVTWAFWPGPAQNGDPNQFIRALEVSADLETFDVIDSYDGTGVLTQNQRTGIYTGDINGDNVQNLIVLLGNGFKIFSFIGEELVLESSPSSSINEFTDAYQIDNVEIADLDRSGKNNLVVAYTSLDVSQQEMRLYVQSREYDENYDFVVALTDEVAVIPDYDYSYMYFGLSAGNFDGNDIYLGEPVFSTCIYRRPLYSLSPPPTHFDVINGEVFDESGCYTGDNCLFSSSNVISQTTSSTLSIEEYSDWQVSYGLSYEVSGDIEGINFESGPTLEAKFGLRFENESNQTNTMSISVQNTTTIDELIKGISYPVDHYEYPVYNNRGQIVQYISAAFPIYSESQEYTEQAKLDQYYIPSYEPGNLLSYPPIGTIDDFEFYSGDPNSIIYVGPSYTMTNNPGSSSSANIVLTEETEESYSTQWDASLEVSFTQKLMGVGYELTGSYETGGLETNSTTIEGTEGWGINYDNIGGPSGYYAYTVKPYLFWAESGFAMLAYQVDLNSSQSSPTWWDETYGQMPDPALMLPKRNEVYWTTGADPENVLFTQSKSMSFDQLYPNLGDTVTVTCRIHNYSLMSTPDPVQVQFYNGHPDQGGQLVADLSGATSFQTASAISARGMQEVEMQFTMMEPVNPNESFVRFYALIDPENAQDEIHEDNNLGWQVIGYDCVNGLPVGLDEVDAQSPESSLELWPNPTNGDIHLQFQNFASQTTYLEVYDLTGKSVMTRNLGILPQGSYTHRLDLPELAPGLYVVRVMTDHGEGLTGKFLVSH